MSSATPTPEDTDRSDTPGDQPTYGFPARLWRSVEEHPPPGYARLMRWRSPLRGPWLTSVFGAVLLASLPLVIVTGLLDYIAYGPQFGQASPVRSGGCTCRSSTGRPGRRGCSG